MSLVLGLAALASLGGGGSLVYSAVTAYQQSVQAAEEPMPMPSQDFSVDSSEARTIPSGSLDETAPNRGEIASIDASGRDVLGAPAKYCKTPTRWSPSRLYIPSMCVQAPLLTTSAPDGSMELPNNPAKVAWLSTTAAIDATAGSSVISGHVNVYGRKGALYDLAVLGPGTRIYLTDATGKPRTFAVTTLKAYRKAGLPEAIFTPSGPRQIALVTCGGKLIHGARGSHYEDNVVAIATPIAESP